MSAFSRREFVKGSAASTTFFFLGQPAFARRRHRRSPNEEIRACVAGINGQGWTHVRSLNGLENVRVVALCDVDSKVLARRKAEFETDTGQTVATYADFREVVERDDIDVVSMATPNHHHSLQTIWACQNGKDVYVEKPISHNVWEGRQAVNAARKYERIVQTGTQSRSSQGMTEGIEWIQAGNLGKMTLAHGLCYKPRQSIGKTEGPQEVPENIDWDLWCGPASDGPLRRRRVHYDWHWQFETGCGDLGNQGIHQMDMCRWAIGADALSPRVISVGGRFGYDDDGDTPNTQFVYHDYDSVPILFEVRGLPTNKEAQEANWNGSMDRVKGVAIGVVVHTEGGYLVIPNYNSATAYDKEGKEVKKWHGSSSHYQNFIDAVRSRDAGALSADIEEGHLSSALCHTGNISYQLGRERPKSAIAANLERQKVPRYSFDRMCQHLEANGVDLEKHKATIGPWLDMNPEEERFETSEAANQRLSRLYRIPFVVPAEV